MSESYSLVQISSLADATVKFLSDNDKENEPNYGYEINGGILSDTKLIWKSYGPRFIVINSKTGTKISAWTFGAIVKDYSAKIVCVDELPRPMGKLPLLVIGIECNGDRGMICIFNISGSKVLRAIHIYEKVTSLQVMGVSHNLCPLPGSLRAFDGILAVGTAGGNVLLLDICRQAFEEGFNEARDEVDACQIKYVLMNDISSLDLHKQIVSKSGDHLAININVNDTPHFILKGPNGEDRVHVNKEEVTVTALHYCPQLCSLLVGYNFGAWQLWDVINMKLTYTSPVYEENIPVTHFAIQEPSDDPKAFCYVWVVYSNVEVDCRGFPVAVLYSLNYKSKEWHEGYGILYQDLICCRVRFQTDLSLIDKDEVENVPQGGRCLRLQSINKSVSKSSFLQEYQEETVSICSIVWGGWRSDSSTVSTYLSLFDLNQWYKQQMPYSPRPNESNSYVSYTCLNNIIGPTIPKYTRFIDVRIDINTLSQFVGTQKLEEHYYPSSLAFQLCALNENNVILFNNQGSQRAFLSNLENSGPLILVKPAEFVQLAIDLGLHPLFVEVSSDTLMSSEAQREFLLSVGLEYQLLGWLCRCASSCSNGTFSSMGFTLHSLLMWGWRRVQILKENADKLTVPLFDYSGLRLDSNTHKLLSNCVKQLRGLTTLFGFVVHKLINFAFNPDAVNQQWDALQMISLHLEVLQWLLNVGLLPECPLSRYPRIDEHNRISAPYPVDELITYYNERRTTLQTLNKEQFSTSGSLLFIDNLIDLECGGRKLQEQWEHDGGNGLYPPPSLQALLRTYLIEDVKIPVKHSIIVYVFLDLAMTLVQNRYKPIITHLIKFPAVFQLSPSIIKITQAFWQLDHGDFSTAMEQLLDPLVCAEDLKMWHHRIALKALLTQEQHNLALLYLQVRQPTISDVQDLCTILSLYVANDMVDEAFHFQRQNKNSDMEYKLLQHFYQECDRKGKIFSVLYLPLGHNEEKLFMEYLKKVNHPKIDDLQVSFYMQRSRYIDVLDRYKDMNSISSDHKGLKGQNDAELREFIMNGLTESLPEITKNIMSLCRKEKSNLWKTVTRPKPCSVFIHNANSNVRYKSFMHAGLAKAKEIWSWPALDKSPTTNDSSNITTENIPFLNTPKTLLAQTRINTPVVYPKIIRTEKDDDGPSPSKRFKLSPRSPLISPETQRSRKSKNINDDSICVRTDVKIATPLVKRKIPKESNLSGEKFNVGTPQSILKIRNLVHNSESPDTTKKTATLEDINARSPRDSIFIPHEVPTDNINLSTNLKRSFDITPRKSISRTPKPAVRFDISHNNFQSSFGSSSNESVGKVDNITEENSSTLSTSLQSASTSKHSSTNTDDTFYSPYASPTTDLDVNKPNDSANQADNLEEPELLKKKDVFLEAVIPSATPKTRRSYKKLTETLNSIELKKSNVKESSETGTPRLLVVNQTPKSRRSYRESSPVSEISMNLRSRKSLNFNNEIRVEKSKSEISIQTTTIKESLHSSLSTSLSPATKNVPTKSKLKARRSLSRQVLENNTFVKMIESPTTLSNKSDDAATALKSDQNLQSDSIKCLPNVEAKEECQIIQRDNKNDELIQDEETVKTETSMDTDADPIYTMMNTAHISNSLLEPSTVNDENIQLLNTSTKTIDDLNIHETILSPLRKTEQNLELLETNADLTDNDAKDKSQNETEAKSNLPDNMESHSVNIYEDLSNDNYVSADPQMNVFEITDDLDLNEGICLTESVDIDMDTNYSTTSLVIYENSEILSNIVGVEGISDSCESKAINEQPKNIEYLMTTDASPQVPNKDEEAKPSNEIEIIEVGSSSSSSSENSYNDEERFSEYSNNGSSVKSSNEEGYYKYDSNSVEYSENSDEDVANEHDNAFVTETLDSNSNSGKSSTYHDYKTSYTEVTIEECPEENVAVNSENLEVIQEEIHETVSNSKQLPVITENVPVTERTTETSKDILEQTKKHDSETFEKIMASHDILDESETEGNGYKVQLSHLLNNTDILDMTPPTSTVDKLKTIPTDILEMSIESDDLKSNIPGRRSKRSASLKSTPTVEQVSLKRRTRRSSSFSNTDSNQVVSQASTSHDISVSSISDAVKQRRRNSNIETDLPSSGKKGTDVDVDEKQLSSRRTLKNTEASTAKDSKSTPTRKTRASSATPSSLPNQIETEEIKKASGSTRGGRKRPAVTTDKNKTKPNRSTRAKSAELNSPNINIEEYSNTRRLTRRQANMLEKSVGRIPMAIDVCQMNPIVLLDKKDFKDEIDPDEEKVTDQSSLSSSIPDSPIGSHFQKQTKSKDSTSVTSTKTESETSDSSKNRQTTKRVSSEPSGVYSRTRQRSKSVDEECASNESVPPKLRRTRKNSKDSDDLSNTSDISQTQSLVEPTKPLPNTRLRARSKSTTCQLETLGVVERKTRRQTAMAKPKLPLIREEQNLKSDESGDPVKTTLRKSKK